MSITYPTRIALESNQGLRGDSCCSGWYGSAYCHPVERCKPHPCYHRTTYIVSCVHYRRDIYYSHMRCCCSYAPVDGRKRQCLVVTCHVLNTGPIAAIVNVCPRTHKYIPWIHLCQNDRMWNEKSTYAAYRIANGTDVLSAHPT